MLSRISRILLLTLLLGVFTLTSSAAVLTKMSEWQGNPPAKAYRAVVLTPQYAYCARRESGIDIINITNPASPTRTSYLDTPGQAVDLWVAGNLLYIADGTNGLQVMDISSPAAPILRGRYVTSSPPTAVSGFNSLAIVTLGENGLVILDMANPDSPILRGSLAIPGLTLDVAVTGSYAFVANHDQGLRIVSMSNPASPSLVGTCAVADQALAVHVLGNYAYVAAGYGGLAIINIQTPTSPSVAGTLDTAGYVSDVAINDVAGYAFLTDWEGGLRVIDIQNPSSPSLSESFNETIFHEQTSLDFTDFSLTLSAQGSNVVMVCGDSGKVALYQNGTIVMRTISGTVRFNGTGLANVMLSRLPGYPKTNTGGVYSAQAPNGWSETVTPIRSGYTMSPAGRTHTNVTADQTGQDYVATPITYTISGTVTINGNPLSGVTMTGLTGNPTTNASGNYTATVAWGFSGTATPTLVGYNFTPAQRSYTNVLADQADQNFTAAVNVYTVTFTPQTGGTIAGVTTQNIPHGGNTTPVTANANSGYGFVNWTGNGFVTTAENPLMVRGIASNLAITANYIAVTNPTTTTITGHTPNPSMAGHFVNVAYTVTANSGTPAGNVTVTDGVDTCAGTVASGGCTLTLRTAGQRTLVATYSGNASSSGSTSPGVTHDVGPALGEGFYPLTPCRVLDTRNTDGPDAASPALGALERREFLVVGRCNLPSNAKAIVANITVVGASQPGELHITAGNLPTTMTSVIAIPLTRARANNAMIQLATDGSGRIAATNESAGVVHMILDVNGYFQ